MLNDSYLLRRQVKQSRAATTVANIAEAAATVLTRDGAGRFTTNRVAEEAGVNIATLYRYFPNKEALLLHLAHLSWSKQLAQLSLVLTKSHSGDAETLRAIIQEYFLTEVREADLRRPLRAAAADIWDTNEYREATSRASDLLRDVIARVSRDRFLNEKAEVNFSLLLITGLAEKSAEVGYIKFDALRCADYVIELLSARRLIG